MTPFEDVYDVFLSKILEDEWDNWQIEEVYADLKMLLLGAIPNFKFPRVSLEFNNDSFIETLSNDEIQILASYMKCEWLNRNIMRWENVKPLYEERDFSQANLIDKFKTLLESEQKRAEKRESNYYRSIKGVPYPYNKLAGK